MAGVWGVLLVWKIIIFEAAVGWVWKGTRCVVCFFLRWGWIGGMGIE